MFEWCGTPPLIRPIGTASSVKYGILLDDIKIMVSSSCIVVDSIRSCFMTLIMQSKDSFLIHGQQQIPFKECSFKLCISPTPRPYLKFLVGTDHQSSKCKHHLVCSGAVLSYQNGPQCKSNVGCEHR